MAAAWSLLYKSNRVHRDIPFAPVARFSSEADARQALRALQTLSTGYLYRIEAPEVSSVAATAASLPFDPSDHTVDEIEDKVALLEDHAVVRRLLALEQEGKARVTAVALFEERLQELEGV